MTFALATRGIVFVVLTGATFYAAACGDDSKTVGGADAAPVPVADGGLTDAPYHRVEEGARTPICVGHDPTSSSPYFELQIDGVTKAAGETKISTDNNGRLQITVGYPTLTQGSSGSQVFYVRFLPDAGSGACDQSAFGGTRSAGYSYTVPNGPTTGAGSDVGSGPCTMTLSIDGGIARGAASGKLSNVTPKYEQTFDFQSCWVQPL